MDSWTAIGYYQSYAHNKDGTLADDSSIVLTGMYIEYNHGAKIYIAVYGDVNGDGYINVSDQMTLKNKMNKTAADVNAVAGDLDYSGYIDSNDSSALSDFIMNGRGNANLIESVDFENSMFYVYGINNSLTKIKYSLSKQVTDSADTVLSKMQNSTLFAFGGHGNSTLISTHYDNTSNPVYIRKSDISALPSNAFSNSRMIMLLSCSTATGGTTADNFARAVYNKGAKTVVAFSKITYTDANYIWSNQFFHYIGLGHTIEEAAFEANYYLSGATGISSAALDGTINGLALFGSKTQRLAQPYGDFTAFDNLMYNAIDTSVPTINNSAEKVIDDNNVKGFYSLTGLNNSEKSFLSSEDNRKHDAEEALSDYIDVNDYVFEGEGYNESLGVYTLNYSKYYNGISSGNKLN